MRITILLITSIVFTLTVTAHAQEEVEFVIPMSRGWNMISAPVIPEDRYIPDIFWDIYQRDNLILVRDGEGNFWVADWGSFLDDWDFREGYMVKLSDPDTLIITGEPVDPETAIPLERGWNLISYLPEQSTDAPTAFANIRDELVIATDGFGRFYAPEHDFSNMVNLRRCSGYWVYVSEDVELVWNQE